MQTMTNQMKKKEEEGERKKSVERKEFFAHL